MRKQILFFLSVMLLSFSLSAQTTKAKPKATQQKAKPAAKKSKTAAKRTTATGWSADEKTVFFESCVKELEWSKDSATRYCNCMLGKIETIYPSAKDAENMTQEKAVELAKECLAADSQSSVWGEKERTQFTTQCEAAAAKNIGADKAKPYCSCMLGKIENEFPDPSKMSLKQETVAKWAAECSKQ